MFRLPIGYLHRQGSPQDAVDLIIEYISSSCDPPQVLPPHRFVEDSSMRFRQVLFGYTFNTAHNCTCCSSAISLSSIPTACFLIAIEASRRSRAIFVRFCTELMESNPDSSVSLQIASQQAFLPP